MFVVLLLHQFLTSELRVVAVHYYHSVLIIHYITLVSWSMLSY